MKEKLNCILLIDDDEPTNYFTNMLIEEADCAVHIQVEEGGQAALNYINKARQYDCQNKELPCPDLIFLDINMPAMNGWEFLEQYDKLLLKQHKKVVIVMLTTTLNPDDILQASRISCVSDFENKPLTLEKLNRIMEKYF